MPTLVPAQKMFIVDDDPAIREALRLVFTNDGYNVVCFADGASLIDATKASTPVCIILDVHIPGKSGLDILKSLNAQDYPSPIFIMSGQGDIAMAVDAVKNGALDFIEKPFRGKEVASRVRKALEARQKNSQNERSQSFYFVGLEPLTKREQEVLGCLIKGASNKIAARELGISYRTVEVHRARIMEKLGAKNASDLIRIALTSGHTAQDVTKITID